VTVAEWVATHADDVPAALVASVKAALDATAAGADAAEAPEVLLVAAESLLQAIVRRESRRDCAVDLLTVDALVTYALEAAAAEPALIEARATAAMRRLAQLAHRARS
jgi:hypothetical protein